jgi:hypothetical protein
MGIKWESNAHNWVPQDHTGRTEQRNLKYETLLDSTRQTDARGFLNRGSLGSEELHPKLVRSALGWLISPTFGSASKWGPPPPPVPSHLPIPTS